MEEVVFIVQYGGVPVGAYSNEYAAIEHIHAIWEHPSTPNRNWGRQTRLVISDTYKPRTEVDVAERKG